MTRVTGTGPGAGARRLPAIAAGDDGVIRRDGGTVEFRGAYQTFEQLLDRAIAEVEQGGRVRASWSGWGFPTFLEIVTMENDAGTGYRISDVAVRD